MKNIPSTDRSTAAGIPARSASPPTKTYSPAYRRCSSSTDWAVPSASAPEPWSAQRMATGRARKRARRRGMLTRPRVEQARGCRRAPELLEALAEGVEAPVEGCGIVPEHGVSGAREQLDLGVRHRRLVLLDHGGLDHRIPLAVGDQHRLPDLRQEVVVVEDTREQPRTNVGGHGGAVAEHQV